MRIFVGKVKAMVAQKANITPRHLDFILMAERNASPGTARLLEKATKIPKSTWVFGTKTERTCSWKKFVKKEEKTA